MSGRHGARFSVQQGFVLMTVLVALALVSTVGLAAAQGARIEMLRASRLVQIHLAFRHGESRLLEFERWFRQAMTACLEADDGCGSRLESLSPLEPVLQDVLVGAEGDDGEVVYLGRVLDPVSGRESIYFQLVVQGADSALIDHRQASVQEGAVHVAGLRFDLERRHHAFAVQGIQRAWWRYSGDEF